MEWNLPEGKSPESKGKNLPKKIGGTCFIQETYSRQVSIYSSMSCFSHLFTHLLTYWPIIHLLINYNALEYRGEKRVRQRHDYINFKIKSYLFWLKVTLIGLISLTVMSHYLNDMFYKLNKLNLQLQDFKKMHLMYVYHIK